eukprot:scaffold96651_cov65-Phaeocystis_antarctica.AAC.6
MARCAVNVKPYATQDTGNLGIPTHETPRSSRSHISPPASRHHSGSSPPHPTSLECSTSDSEAGIGATCRLVRASSAMASSAAARRAARGTAFSHSRLRARRAISSGTGSALPSPPSMPPT